MTPKKSKLEIFRNFKFRVILTWAFFFFGAILVILLFILIFGLIGQNGFIILQEQRYFIVYIEIVSVGLLPVVITIGCEDEISNYGLTLEKSSLLKSLLLSSFLIAFLFSLGYFTTGRIITYETFDFQLDFPLNIYYGILGIFAWGPLEVFFFLWLVYNTEKSFDEKQKIFSWGLIITTILFTLAHVITTRDFYNAFYTGTIFFVLGMIYKYTKNSIGPMVAWTLINGQVWFIAQLLIP
ncbi:MAG: conserved membrane protein of unknown function [Promethearchaeota archaeon]|nr:MAG: conserved membrane protein of unknown function [Candidatus Lokiarchaeota archaeon]